MEGKLSFIQLRHTMLIGNGGGRGCSSPSLLETDTIYEGDVIQKEMKCSSQSVNHPPSLISPNTVVVAALLHCIE